MGIQERRNRERERRRQQILIAARRVIVEKGYGNSTMETIASEAELSPGTLYLYFKSKEELYASLSIRVLNYLMIRLEHIIKQAQTSDEERLENLKNVFMDTYDFDPLILINMFKLQSSETLQNISFELLTEITDLARSILAKIIQVLGQSLKKGAFADRPPIVFADILWGLFSGVILREEIQRVFNENDGHFRSKFELAFEIFLRGLQASEQ